MESGTERELRQVMSDAMASVASDYQRMLDEVGDRHRGCCVEHVKSVLIRESTKLGRTMREPILTTCASVISIGGVITVDP